MSGSAIPDEDLPGGSPGDDYCAQGEMRGYFSDLLECRSGNGLFYRLLCNDSVEFDINPDRVLVRHGQVRLEVRQDRLLMSNGADVELRLEDDRIVSRAPRFEHTGEFHVVAGGSSLSLIDGAVELSTEQLAIAGDLDYQDQQQAISADGVSINARNGRVVGKAQLLEHTGQVFINGELMVSGNVVSQPLFAAEHPTKRWSVAVDQNSVVITEGASSHLVPYAAFTASALRTILIAEGFQIAEYDGVP
jgi:hypothetical protein